ncbi:hypothetical protein [Okeania sp. SIO2B3]|uniref:hypothetical protein n=1 Tax=Okeania sp. SIO2B3 TaxID=2607784 RepID=UPI003448C5D2
MKIIAFAVVDGGSKQIRESLVLPGLKISLLDEALQRSRNMNQRLVGSRLIEKFQQ